MELRLAWYSFCCCEVGVGSGFDEAGGCNEGGGSGGGGSDDIFFEFSIVWSGCRCCSSHGLPELGWGNRQRIWLYLGLSF